MAPYRHIVRPVAAALVVLFAYACSSDDGKDDGTGGTGGGLVLTGGSGNSTSGGNGNSTSGGSGNSTSGGSGNSTSGGSGAAEICNGLPFTTQAGGAGGAEECVGVNHAAEPLPIDMYIMMDRTISMTEPLGTGTQTRWDAVSQAMQQFVQDPAADGVGVGIQFFSITGGANEAVECDVSRYSTPAVPIGLLPGVGQDIVDAIQNTVPQGLTPTHAALQGALEYAEAHAQTVTGRSTVVVLVTDGMPTMCDVTSVADIADLARQAYERSGVLTFVIGLEAGMWNLNQLAMAGGTVDPYVIDAGDGTAQFLDTILNISSSPMSCTFEIPPPPSASEVVNPEMVQFVYTPASGAPEELPRLSGVNLCAQSPNGGWYFDDPQAPTRITVCPCNCARFRAGTIQIRLGCRPRIFDLG
jgi:hypothetical protein